MSDPQLDRLIHTAETRPLDEAAGLYAQADELAVRRGYVIPYGTAKLTTLVSERVDPASVLAHPVFGIDLAHLSVSD